MLNKVILCFVPIFFAINFFGLIPMYLSFTEDVSKTDKLQLVNQACLTVLLTGLIFLVTGNALFDFLGITEGDFKVGGGIILLTISIADLSGKGESRRVPSKQVGVVPLGIPLIMGPAALTTLLVVSKEHGYWATVLALLMNLIIVWYGLRYATLLMRVVGQGGARAVGKIASLFLSAIAISMIRGGLTDLGIIPKFLTKLLTNQIFS